MASTVPHSVADDSDLDVDYADLWAVIDSAVASHSASIYPKTPNSNHSDTKSRVSAQGEVIQEPWVCSPPRKVARTRAPEASEIKMASIVPHSVADDSDLDVDDADLWAVIDSAVASHSASKYPKTPNSNHSDTKSRVSAQGEVIQEPWVCIPPRKVARTRAPEASEISPIIVQRTTTTPVSSSPEIGKFSVKEISASSEIGRFPSVSLFKEYQNTAMAILETSDYLMISGNPFIKRSGWRKISSYFNLSFEIREKTIDIDENRNVQRAEFVVRAYTQGGRFADGWGSCDRHERRFSNANHDIPSTAETRAKNKSCQDLLGIGEYRPGASQGQR